VYFEYKTQDWDQDPTAFTLGQNLDAQNHYVPRGFKQYSPDLWVRFGAGALLVEGEFVAQLGSVQHLDDLGIIGGATIAKLGGVGRATWRGMDKRLGVGLESGFATGDQWSTTQNSGVVTTANLPTPGVLNIGYANLIGDPNICNAQHTCTLTQFTFNRDYIVDLIFWRRLVTAVTNAAYVRPFVSYEVTKSVTVKLWNVTSFALKPVATPGHAVLYGTEFDGDVGYHSGRVHAGLSAGVFLPGPALDHPAGVAYGFETQTQPNANTGSASAAFALTGRLVLAF
jgi:uncharacterized protein (TIGR04551 family)